MKKKDWRKYLYELKITTNSRWLSGLYDSPNSGNFIMPERDFLPKSSKDFHGIWIAEIPYQMIMRFTDEDDLVWSQFGGSGVDKEVCDVTKRRCFINDLKPTKDFIIQGDSRTIKLDEKCKLILSHPPYWDMLKFTEDKNDGSNKETLCDFLEWWEEIVINSYNNLHDNGYFVYACGNLYKESQEITLGNLMLLSAFKHNFILKQQIIKDYGETKGSNKKNYNLNYRRQLKGGYGNFYGDNIFILRKAKKNKVYNEITKYLNL